jgi:hypothetical protein
MLWMQVLSSNNPVFSQVLSSNNPVCEEIPPEGYFEYRTQNWVIGVNHIGSSNLINLSCCH